jgi:hypothetical protein
VCGQCELNCSGLFSCLFGKTIGAPDFQKLTVVEYVEVLNGKFREFVLQCLESEERGVFLKQSNKIKIKLEPKMIPIRVVTHHKTLEGALGLARSIDKSFKGGSSEKAVKGVIIAVLNKRVELEMWWGETVTTFDRFARWVLPRESSLVQDSAYMLFANVEQVSSLLGNRRLFEAPLSELIKPHQ